MFYKILLFLDKLIEKAKREQAYKLFKQNSNSKIASDFKLGNNYYYDISPKAIIEIEDNVTMNESNYLTIKSDAKFFVGKNTYITRATISCLGEISIGENTLFGENVRLYDHNHKYDKKVVFHQEFNTGQIKIGKNCWLGTNVVVLKDVTIGDNVIIGAGCVIHKDVPANSIIINKQEQLIKKI